MKQQNEIVKYAVNVVVTFIVIAGAVFFGKWAYREIVDRIIYGTAINERLMHISSEINKNCPYMMDKMTRLDQTWASGTGEFAYMITIMGNKSDEIDKEKFEVVIEKLFSANIKNSPDLSLFRENNIELIFVFRDEQLNEIAKVFKAPAEY